MDDYFNVPPSIICPPCICTVPLEYLACELSENIHLCVSNVHNKEYAPLRLLIGYFMLVGSAMFGAIFNLVTRVGLP